MIPFLRYGRTCMLEFAESQAYAVLITQISQNIQSYACVYAYVLFVLWSWLACRCFSIDLSSALCAANDAEVYNTCARR